MGMVRIACWGWTARVPSSSSLASKSYTCQAKPVTVLGFLTRNTTECRLMIRFKHPSIGAITYINYGADAHAGACISSTEN